MKKLKIYSDKTGQLVPISLKDNIPFKTKRIFVIHGKKKFIRAVEENSFQKLKNIENKYGFHGWVESEKKKKNFFNLGPKNDYKKLLDKNISEEIEKKFYSEMKELNYL